MLNKFVNKKIFKLNSRGATMIAVLGTAVISGTIIVGLNKFLQIYSSHSKSLAEAKRLNLIKAKFNTFLK